MAFPYFDICHLYQNKEKPVKRQRKLGQCVLLDFSLNVRAATLIFISGCGSAIPSAKEGKSDLFIIW